MCLTCKSLLHTNNTADETEFLRMSSETYERIRAYAASVSMNISEVNLLDVLNEEDSNDYDIKMETMDFDDEPLVKSEMVETVLTEDIHLKLEGIEDHSGGNEN